MRLVCPLHHELQNSLIVYIVCLIGLDSPQSEYLALSLKMMDFKYSLGLIGGKPKKALYFLGRIEDDLIYLDPHYVQEFTNGKNFQKSSHYDTYFCKKFQTYPSKNIDSSFSLMFYLKDLQQLEEFYQFMMGLKREYNDHFFMMLEDSEPAFCLGDGRNSSNLISPKNLMMQAEQQSKQRQKQSQQQQQPNFDDIEDVDSDFANDNNQNKNGKQINSSKYNNNSNSNNNGNNKKVEYDDDDYEVI